MDPKVAGLLAYLFGWVSGLIILLTEKQHQPTRFHAAQSIVVFGAFTVVAVLISALSVIPIIGWILALVGLLLAPVAFILWIFLMIRAYQLTEIRLPVVATFADQLLGKSA